MLDDRQLLARRNLFRTCDSMEELQRWIKFYLGVELPSFRVDPTSTSSPMELVWEIYQCGLDRGDPEKTGYYLAYASRDAYKTLGAAIAEVLMLLHCNRDVVHLAAVLEQGEKAQLYIEQFMSRALLRNYLADRDNTRKKKRFIRYQRPGDPVWAITEAEWSDLPEANKDAYRCTDLLIELVPCTMRGVNCLGAGTLVETREGLRRIEEVRPGEEVVGVDLATGESAWNLVGSVSSTEKPAMALELGGRPLVASEDHPLFTRSGWTRARHVRSFTPVLAEATSFSAEPKVDLTTESPHRVDEPRSVLLGMLFGDASLTWPTQNGRRYGAGPRFRTQHAADQLWIVDQAAAALDAMGIGYSRGERKEQQGGYASDQSHFWLASRVAPELADLYWEMYGTGRKALTAATLARLDHEALAAWVMDDGCGEHVDGSAAVGDAEVRIASCNFDAAEHDLAIGRLAEMGYSAKAMPIEDGKYLVLRFDTESSHRLAADVDKYFPPGLKYKLPTPINLCDTLCLRCGRVLALGSRTGFSCCDDCAWITNGVRRPARCKKDHEKIVFQDLRRSLRERCVGVITKRTFLGTKKLWDLHVATNEEHRRNFWVYLGDKRYLVHNSRHALAFFIDEVDVVENPKAYYDAKLGIPTSRGGRLPITFMFSTRKSSVGLVQKEIDDAPETGLKILHWSALDMTERCPPAKHLPGEPRVPIYVDDKRLHAVSETDWLVMPELSRQRYRRSEGFAGCLRKCAIFAECGGVLAQPLPLKTIRCSICDRRHPLGACLLKPLAHFESQCKKNDADIVSAQLLCRKPESHGLVYPSLDEDLHVLSAQRMAQVLVGRRPAGAGEDEPEFPATFDEAALVELFRQRGCGFDAGMDFGTSGSHLFAAPIAAVDAARIFVFDYIEFPELDLPQMVTQSQRIKELGADVWPDMAALTQIKYFRRKRFKMRTWKKGGKMLGGEHTVKGGIDLVKAKLRPAASPPELYFLDTPRVRVLFNRLRKYKWKVDAAGNVTEQPAKVDDDGADALRYLVLGKFMPRGVEQETQEYEPKPYDKAGATIPLRPAESATYVGLGSQSPAATLSELARQQVRRTRRSRAAPQVQVADGGPSEFKRYVEEGAVGDADAEEAPKTGRRGRLSWSF